MAEIDLISTYYWNGEKFGPGKGVKVPAEMAAWLNPSQGKVAPASDPSDLPEDFPARDLILGTQWGSAEALKAATDEELLAVDGIGKKTLESIRKALG